MTSSRNEWSLREKLALASSVLRNGDQNWVSVSRAVRPFAEPGRPDDWFSQKNCARQYSELLEDTEVPRRKRERGETTESAGDVIVRRLAIQWSEELKKLVDQEKLEYLALKAELATIKDGQMDDKLEEMWEELQLEEQNEIEISQEKEGAFVEVEATASPKTGPSSPKDVKLGDFDKADSNGEECFTTLADASDSVAQSLKDVATPQMMSRTSLVSMDIPEDSNMGIRSSLVRSPSSTCGERDEGLWMADIKKEVMTPVSTFESQSVWPGYEDNINVKEEPMKNSQSSQQLASAIDIVITPDVKVVSEKQEVTGTESGNVSMQTTEESGLLSVPDVKSPTKRSSAASIDSTLGDVDHSRKEGTDATTNTLTKTPSIQEKSADRKDSEAGSRFSEAEITDDDTVASEDAMLKSLAVAGESLPNSPASIAQSETEADREYKTWKKSIMLVWRAAANHKFASVFMHPVTEDVAPGYHSTVFRPMDLSTIKKNIECGVIRSTNEFQRDIMLMFTNAIMYNSSRHDVYQMAEHMYDDVLSHIEQYVSTQMMVRPEVKSLRTQRQQQRSDVPEKEEETKKRRTSVETPESSNSSKSKKRR